MCLERVSGSRSLSSQKTFISKWQMINIEEEKFLTRSVPLKHTKLSLCFANIKVENKEEEEGEEESTVAHTRGSASGSSILKLNF